MHIEIPFEAALILEETDLKHDHPDVWTRYLNNRTIRFTRRVGALVKTSVGRSDMTILRDYFYLWLHYESLLPEAEQDKKLVRLSNYAASMLSAAIERSLPTPQDAEAR